MGEPRISVVGMIGRTFGPGADQVLAEADVVVGSARQLALLDEATARRGPSGPAHVEHVELVGPLGGVLDAVERRLAQGHRVCILASGDPGFFGIVGVLGSRFGHQRLEVHPAPSSVSLAFARLGMAWDDAVVVSAHGRPLAEACRLATGAKVAVLTSPDNPPEALGAALLSTGCPPREVAVASHLGSDREVVIETDLVGLAEGTFDPMSVVVLRAPSASEHTARLSWGLPEKSFAYRDGMITKAEVRAVALGKLSLPRTGVLWDVGAGSGSVAIECARLSPGLRVIAIERHPEDAARVEANARQHGVAVEVVVGEAPGALASLPDPDRVFIGGGGLPVLDHALERLGPGGMVVATYVVLDRAVAAMARLPNLVQVGVARAVPVGRVGIRLAAENPVFVCWGPEPDEPG